MRRRGGIRGAIFSRQRQLIIGLMAIDIGGRTVAAAGPVFRRIPAPDRPAPWNMPGRTRRLATASAIEDGGEERMMGDRIGRFDLDNAILTL